MLFLQAKPKGNHRHKEGSNRTSEESIPIIHYSNKTRNVTGSPITSPNGNDSPKSADVEPALQQNQTKLALSELHTVTGLLDCSEKIPHGTSNTLVNIPQSQLSDAAISSRTLCSSRHFKVNLHPSTH